LRYVICTTLTQQLHNNADVSSIFIFKKKENVRFTTPTQQLHNNPSHEGGPHTLGSTFM
jgi:hypothetical protein